MMSFSVSSEKRMEYRYLSIWGTGTGHKHRLSGSVQNVPNYELPIVFTHSEGATTDLKINPDKAAQFQVMLWCEIQLKLTKLTMILKSSRQVNHR